MRVVVAHELPGRLRLRTLAPMQDRGCAVVRTLESLDGLTAFRITPLTGSILVRYDEQTVSRHDIVAALLAIDDRDASPVLQIGPLGQGRAGATLPQVMPGGCATEPAAEENQGSLVGFVVSAAMNSVLPLPVRLLMLARRAWPRIKAGIKALLRGEIGVEVLDAVAIAICLGRRDYKSAATITTLLALGDHLESFTRQKSELSLTEALASKTTWAWICREGEGEHLVDAGTVEAGDIVVVRHGGSIPVDGVVVDGEAMVNESSLTGEAEAVAKRPGSAVFAGSALDEGELHVRATVAGRQSRFRRLSRLVTESERRKAGLQGQAEKLASKLAPVSLGLAAGVYALTRDSNRASSVLTVDYSCAIKLATPLAVFAAMRQAAEIGVAVKGGKHLEDLAKADTVVFDKTGTLTMAEPRLVEVCAFDDYGQDEILCLAACLEEHFPHPVAKTIVHEAKMHGLVHPERHAKVEYVVAHGIATSYEGKRVLLGSRHFVVEDEGADLTAAMESVERCTQAGYSLLYLAVSGRVVGLIALDDPIRPETAEAIAALRADGIKQIIMLTGDTESQARRIAAQAGISDVRAGVLPDEKHSIIEELKAKGHVVAMIGDGVNDAAALSTASVGIAMRAGADIAREAADIVLASGDLRDLVAARALARATLARIKTNYLFIVAVNTALLAAGLLGRLSPSLGALLHNAATVGAALNAVRPMALPAKLTAGRDRSTPVVDYLEVTAEESEAA